MFSRAMGGGVYGYDLLGRQTRQLDTLEGGRVVYDHVQAYDAKGRVETDTVTQLQGSDIVTSITSNQYGDGTTSYALGAVTRATTSGSRLVNGFTYQASPGTATAIGYAWYDGAVQSQVDYTPNTAAPMRPAISAAWTTAPSRRIDDPGKGSSTP